MKLTIKRWNKLSEEDRRVLLARSETDITRVTPQVSELVDRVRAEGDRALIEATQRFDGADLSQTGLRVSDAEIEAAVAGIEPRIKQALDYAIENVERFHTEQNVGSIPIVEVRPGILAGERTTPIASAGLYVPRGRGSFPSMLYMLAVPARIAGVERIVVATPPGPDGSVDPACLYTAQRCGVHEIYRVGGAQAVAALAYGTESIRPVLKIVGPGSMYVAAAKHLVHHVVDVGLPAGPSESIILADRDADPWKVALDLLIEAEHGSDSQALLITPSIALAEAVAEILPELVDRVPEPRKSFLRDVLTGYGGILLAESIENAAELVNEFAPEHLQLQTASPWETMALIKNAGEILLGEDTPFSAANYVTGPNAVLPTGGTARTFSAVSVRDFVKQSSVVHVTPKGYADLKDHVVNLAEYEGFFSHAEALKRRDQTL